MRAHPGQDGQRQQHTRTFATTTKGLTALRDWLGGQQVTMVGMESTGAYWKAVDYRLETTMDCWLLNARHLRNVPGRKTDVADAAWIAQLARARPGPPQLRATAADPGAAQPHPLPQDRHPGTHPPGPAAGAGCWPTPAPELSCVATDILGVSGRAMLAALVAGVRDPMVLAELAKGRLRAKPPNSKRPWSAASAPPRAAGGRDAHPAATPPTPPSSGSASRSAASPPLHHDPGAAADHPRGQPAHRRGPLGQDRRAPAPVPARRRTWPPGPGLCPGTGESAGKHHSGRTRKGSKWLRGALVEAAHAAARTKDTYPAAQYRRLGGRRNHQRATVAVAHSILVIAYHLLDRASPMPTWAVTGCSSASPPAPTPSGWFAS